MPELVLANSKSTFKLNSNSNSKSKLKVQIQLDSNSNSKSKSKSAQLKLKIKIRLECNSNSNSKFKLKIQLAQRTRSITQVDNERFTWLVCTLTGDCSRSKRTAGDTPDLLSRFHFQNQRWDGKAKLDFRRIDDGGFVEPAMDRLRVPCALSGWALTYSTCSSALKLFVVPEPVLGQPSPVRAKLNFR